MKDGGVEIHSLADHAQGSSDRFVIPAQAGIQEGEAGMRDGFRRRFFSR